MADMEKFHENLIIINLYYFFKNLKFYLSNGHTVQCNTTRVRVSAKTKLSKQIVLGPFRRLGALFRIYSKGQLISEANHKVFI